MNRTEIEQAFRVAPEVIDIKLEGKPRKTRHRISKLKPYAKYILEYRFSGRSFEFIANRLKSSKGVTCNRSTVKRFFDHVVSL